MPAALGMLLLFALPQFAVPVELKVPSDCEAAFADFEARVRASVVGLEASNRRASVVIQRRGARYRIEVRTQADAAVRAKQLSTASCEDAASAATAVLALALSDPAALGESATQSSKPASVSVEAAIASYESADSSSKAASADPATLNNEPAHARGVTPTRNGTPAVTSSRLPASRDASAAASGVHALARGEASNNAAAAARNAAPESGYRGRARSNSDEAVAAQSFDRDEPSVAPQRVRLALRAGIDTGTLASATGYLGALAAIPAGPFEWRAVVAYGLPSVEERIDPGISELRREQFLLVDVGGCYGFGERVWLAACAAGELNVVQRARVLGEVSDERTWVGVAGVLAAHIAYRGSRLQPEFELGAATTALGARDAGPLALRASFGLGLQF